MSSRKITDNKTTTSNKIIGEDNTDEDRRSIGLKGLMEKCLPSPNIERNRIEGRSIKVNNNKVSKSIVSKSIVGKSIVGKSIVGKSIVGKSIVGKSIVGKSIVSHKISKSINKVKFINGNNFLILPPLFKKISSLYKALNILYKFNLNRKLNVIFPKHKNSIERMCKFNVDEELLNKLRILVPKTITFKLLSSNNVCGVGGYTSGMDKYCFNPLKGVVVRSFKIDFINEFNNKDESNSKYKSEYDMKDESNSEYNSKCNNKDESNSEYNSEYDMKDESNSSKLDSKEVDIDFVIREYLTKKYEEWLVSRGITGKINKIHPDFHLENVEIEEAAAAVEEAAEETVEKEEFIIRSKKLKKCNDYKDIVSVASSPVTSLKSSPLTSLKSSAYEDILKRVALKEEERRIKYIKCFENELILNKQTLSKIRELFLIKKVQGISRSGISRSGIVNSGISRSGISRSGTKKGIKLEEVKYKLNNNYHNYQNYNINKILNIINKDKNEEFKIVELLDGVKFIIRNNLKKDLQEDLQEDLRF